MLALVVAAVLSSTVAPSDYDHVVAAAEADVAAGDFARARERLAAAYAESSDPAYLYARAQIERLAGDCEQAIVFFELFLAEADDADRADAQENIEACREEDASAEAEPTPPPPVVVTSVDDPAPEERGPPRRPVPADPLAITCAAVGAPLTIAGGVLVGLAVGRPASPGMEGSESAYDEALARDRRRLAVGAPLAAVGGALVLTSVVRWAVLSRRQRDTQAAWTPTLRF